MVSPSYAPLAPGVYLGQKLQNRCLLSSRDLSTTVTPPIRGSRSCKQNFTKQKTRPSTPAAFQLQGPGGYPDHSKRRRTRSSPGLPPSLAELQQPQPQPFKPSLKQYTRALTGFLVEGARHGFCSFSYVYGRGQGQLLTSSSESISPLQLMLL